MLKLRKFLLGKKAFTITELMMTVATAGTVITLAAPDCTNMIESAKAVEAVNIMGSIKSAQHVYKLETGTYTANINDLLIKLPDPASPTYWTYRINEASEAGFAVTAIRTNKRAPEGVVGQTIIFRWDDKDLVSWSGTHAGVPS